MNKYKAFYYINQVIKDIIVYRTDMNKFFTIVVIFNDDCKKFLRLECKCNDEGCYEYYVTPINDTPYPYDDYDDYLIAYVKDVLAITQYEIDWRICEKRISTKKVHTDDYFNELKSLIKEKEKELEEMKDFYNSSVSFESL